MFLAACLGLAGKAQRGYTELGGALGQPGEQMTHGQRALWIGCAHGRYGGAGRTLIRDWLAGYVRSLDAAAAAAQLALWQADVAAGGPAIADGLPESVSLAAPDSSQLAAPLAAAEQLRRLSTLVREAVTGEPAVPAATGAADPGPAATGAADPAAAALAAVGLAISAEGSEEEIPLQRRAHELREVIGGRKVTDRPSWEAPAGATLELLHKDAFGADLHLRRVALASCAEWVTRIAALLAAQAGTAPPARIPLHIRGQVIQVDPSRSTSLSEAYADIDKRLRPKSIIKKLFYKDKLAEEARRAKKRLAESVSEATSAIRQRQSDIRAAAAQAAADRDAITADLAAIT